MQTFAKKILSGIDKLLTHTRMGMLSKLFLSRLELRKLKYYKRNPLEQKALDLVNSIYSAEQGSFSSILFRGESTVLFNPCELLNVWEQARIMANHGGVFAEVGVFRGASATLICEAKNSTPLYLFDTFNGLPEVGRNDTRFQRGMFIAGEEKVRKRLSKYNGVEIYPGIFPGTATRVQNLKFSFVHLDVDLYNVTRDALHFFYPRMLPGGRILSHDYGQCEGVWRAFDEFIVGKPEKLQPMETTQVLLIKS